MRQTDYFLLLVLGLSAQVTARNIEKEYDSIEDLLSMDIHTALKTLSINEILFAYDDDFELVSSLTEDVLLDLLHEIGKPNSGATIKIPKIDRAFEFHSNATGSVKYSNVTANFTERGYKDFHTDTESHSGHYHGVMYREGQIGNSTHLVLSISEGKVEKEGYMTEMKERSWTHVFVKNKDNTVTQIANTTQGYYAQINSTSEGKFNFDELMMGYNNMSNSFFAWGDRRDGSINTGAGGVNWTATGHGALKALNSTTNLDPSFLLDLLINKKMKMATLVDSGAIANITDSTAGMIKQGGSGPMPYSTSLNETIVVSANATYNNSETVNGFIWQTPALAPSGGAQNLYFMDIVNLFK